MIEIEDVSKQFDRILALDGVSAQIEENCIFGLVGTNGAGKSTLLRIISGVLHPDHGPGADRWISGMGESKSKGTALLSGRYGIFFCECDAAFDGGVLPCDLPWI